MKKYKKIYIIILILISLFIINSVYKIYLNLKENYKVEKYFIVSNNLNNNINRKVDYIGVIQIPKIKLERVFYDFSNDKNNVDKNIQIINDSDMPDVINGVLVMAAHSGTNNNAYFANLDKLEINDKINIYYNNLKYQYEIIDYYKIEKNGKLEIKNNNESLLVLTTCDEIDNTKQIVYISKLISVN